MLNVEQQDFPLLMTEWYCGECSRWYLERSGWDLAICQMCGKVMTDNGQCLVKGVKAVEEVEPITQPEETT